MRHTDGLGVFEHMMRTNKPILLVEDDEVDVLTVRRALKELKVANQLAVASNGEEALEMLTDEKAMRPALILLDLNMPRMSGLEFLQRARTDGFARGIPIVVLTTSRQDKDIVQGFDYNVAGYMVKPVDYGKFVEVMEAINLYWTLSELPA